MSVIDESMRPMLDTFIFETTSLLDRLDEILLEGEKEKALVDDQINEIFRTMHTIKGSAAMMGLSDMSEMTHKVEDLFFMIRDEPDNLNETNSGIIFDILFEASDFLRQELGNLQDDPDEYKPGDPSSLTTVILKEIDVLKKDENRTDEAAPISQTSGPQPPEPTNITKSGNLHFVRVFFQDGCQMENVRAFMLTNQLKEVCEVLETEPSTPEANSDAIREIVDNGFMVKFRFSGKLETIFHIIEEATNVASYELEDDEYLESTPTQCETPEVSANVEKAVAAPPAKKDKPAAKAPTGNVGKQSLISVNQSKLDSLVNIMGEIVIAESMVASNPDIKDLPLDNFNKSARQLRKLTDQLQDIVMSIRMVPLTGVFQKMQRIVRDMNKNLGKNTELVCIGGDTEVDKNITDVLADPLMHMIRNSVDHGIETNDERLDAGKSKEGTVTLSAETMGSDIIITVKDDGKGLDREKLLDKAEKNGLATKARSEYSDKDAFMLIMAPGFSTNEVVTEYSGRGVGMDVVRKNIEKVGGNISVDSIKGKGTTFTIKIPLTLAIVDGMEIGVGNDIFTIPITSISQIYKLSPETELLYDTDGTEMVMVRGECYPIVRLHKIYNVETDVLDLSDGILIIVESGVSKACIFTDRLVGEQQVVVKSFPAFFNRYDVKGLGFSGCTIMGDGSISLILDINSLLGSFRNENSLAQAVY